MPASDLGGLHMDPPGPTPSVSRSRTAAELPTAAVGAILDAGPGSETSLLVALELRQLGGALGRRSEGAGAMSTVDGRFVAFGAGLAASPELAARAEADATRLMAALAPYATDGTYLNFADFPVPVDAAYPAATWDRLRAVRAGVDPEGRIVANHPVPV